MLRQLVRAAIDAVFQGRDWLMNFMLPGRRTRQARIEAELDRKQDEMRATILQLATALSIDAHEARKALIRESFLASGRVSDLDR